MADRPRTRWWHPLTKRIASSRLGASVFARTLHHLDRVTLRLSGGRRTLSSLLAGLPIITLTTTGAKSGLPRSVPLIAIPDGDELIVIGSNWGQARHPAWVWNLRAHPQATVERDGEVTPVTAREVTGAERDARWQRAVAVYPGYELYKARTGRREIPVVVLKSSDWDISSVK